MRRSVDRIKRQHLWIGSRRVGRAGNRDVMRTEFRRMGTMTDDEAFLTYQKVLSVYDDAGWWTRNDKAGRWLQRH